MDPNKVPVTVFDETADAYFLRTSKDDPTNHLISKEATNPLHNMFVTLKPQDPELDLSFAWEFMVRLPEMPAVKTYGSGYWASGGFSFMADANYGYFMVAEGTTDANMQIYNLQFPMEHHKQTILKIILPDKTKIISLQKAVRLPEMLILFYRF